MNAPVIWIVIPAFFSMITLTLRRYDKLLFIIGTGFTALWSLLALVLPPTGSLELGIVSVQVGDTLTIFGRQFILNAAIRDVIALIYLAAAVWIGGAYFAQVPSLIVPIGSGVAALSAAALTVEPFLYAPLFIEVAVLLSVPFIVPIGSAAGRGVIRYIIFQTLGVPFILLAGWMLTGANTGLNGSEVGISLGVTLGLGFAFLLAVFPLHSWIPMLAEESHPYVVSFVFFFLPIVTTLFGLKLLYRYPWIVASSSGASTLISVVAAIMAIVGGFWTAFQRHLARMMAFTLVMDIGLLLLLISSLLQTSPEVPVEGLIIALLVSRGISLAVWSISLSTLTKSVYGDRSQGFHFREAQGAAKRYPISAAGIIFSQLSMAGFPLLAGFPIRLGSLEVLVRISPWISIVAIIASVGVLIGALRTTAVLVMGHDENYLEFNESPGQGAAIMVGIVTITLIGIFPQWFITTMARVGVSFLNAVR